MTEKRRITDAVDCGQNCMICYKTTLQMRWIMTISCVVVLGLGGLIAAIESNRQDTRKVELTTAGMQEKLEYAITSINDIKKAMGLEVRMSPKLEALK